MAMLISKFHRMIQSKVVWYIVLGVIVISFVGFFTPTIGARRGVKSAQKKAQTAGELFGKAVSRQDLRNAVSNIHLWQILTTGRMPQMDDQTVRRMEEAAWQRLAVLRKAEQEKIMATDREVIQQIQRLPVFMNRNTGAFDKQAYQAVLGQIGVSPRQVEAVVREQVALQKLMFRPVQAALISPYELNRAYHMYTDRLVLKYAVLPRTQVEKDVSVTRDEAKAFFEENQEMFRMPAKVRVSYVEYKVDDFVAQADVPEGAALQAYNANIDRYRIESTGDVSEVEYKPFEEVEPEITAILSKNAARRLALEQANALVADIAPKSPGQKPDFKGAAAAAGLTVKSLPAFGPDDELKGIDMTAPFRKVALGLQADDYSSFSDAIAGQDSVYVLSLEQRYESFLPGFDIVEKDVMEATRSRKVSDAVAERSSEIQDALTKALEAGTAFEEAVKPFGLAVVTTAEFDLRSDLDDPYADVLVPACVTVEQGALCEPTPVEDGVLFTQVARRTQTDAELGLPAMRDELVSGLARVRSQRLAADWQDELIREADLKIDEM